MYQNTLKELERLQRSHDTLAERIGVPESTDINDSARSLHAEMESGPEDQDDSWLKGEAISVYKQLRALALQLNTGNDDDSGTSLNVFVPECFKVIIQPLISSLDLDTIIITTYSSCTLNNNKLLLVY